MRLIVPLACCDTGAEIVCRGTVVRVVPVDGMGGLSRVAATITDYQLVRQLAHSQVGEA